MEQNKSFNEHPHPCVGVMYPAFLNDVEPATGRDLPPDGMTLEEIESMVVLRTGRIGYVKFENPQEYAELCEPQWGDVDDMGDLDDDCFGVIYPAILDEIDPLHDSEPEVKIVNAPFDMAKVVCTT